MANTNAPKKTQKDMLIVLVLSLILGLGGGYALGANSNTNDSPTTETTEQTGTTDHSHSAKYEVETENAPKVELVVTEDVKSGYNIKVIATNFKFTPEDVNGDNVMNEGHAHLYVDGVKVARLYSPYFHYDGSFEGTKTFRVTLNANDHSEYAFNGETIDSEVQVTHDSSDPAHAESHGMEDDSHSE